MSRRLNRRIGEFYRGNGFFEENRRQQAAYWLKEALEAGLKSMFFQDPDVQAKMLSLEQPVLDGRISPFAAAAEILQLFRKG